MLSIQVYLDMLTWYTPTNNKNLETIMPKVLPPPVKLVWEMTIKELPLVTFDLSSVRFDFIQNRFDVEMYESPTNNSVRPVFHRLIQGLPGNFNLPTSVTVTFVMKDDAG